MITLQNLTLRRSTKVLLEDANLTLYAKHKVGLIGDNGCGKSSFFSLLHGDLEADKGELYLPNDLEIAYVKQEIPTSDQAAIEYVIDGDHRYRTLERMLEDALSQGNANLLAKCHDELANIDGYAIEGKAQKILRGLGFHAHQMRYPTTDFSGGWRMRLNLAQALMSRANLMLLDEPTNHLDLDAIVWLEKWLQDYQGTLLIISHDREFLDNTVTQILHFQNQNFQLYRGNFSSFEIQKAQYLSVQQATHEKQQAHIAHLQSFVDRFKAKASKAKQAQSRMKAIEKIQLVGAVEEQNKFKFAFRTARECPNPLLRIEHANLGYSSEKPIILNVDIQLAPTDRIGLLGVNGAGKSTLIKSIAGVLPPLSGSIHHYKGIKVGYFAQHQIEHLNLDLSPLEMMRELSSVRQDQELRSFLGSFNFSGTMATDKIHHFSGGEKARLALALIVWQTPNILLLDEPTNHLDMNMREALILALQDYAGALILVSHDRHLIRTTTDELMIVADNKVSRFTGDLDDYREISLQKTSESGGSQRKSNRNVGKEKRKLETALHSVEKELSELQDKKIKLEAALADHALYENDPSESIKQHTSELTLLNERIQSVEERWLKLHEQLESAN